MKKEKHFYTLIPLEDFKALMGVDDREDKTARFCLVTATLAIEQYCMRQFLRKKHFERIPFTGDLFLPLREYPVVAMRKNHVVMNNGAVLDPKLYSLNPQMGIDVDLPFYFELSPIVNSFNGLKFIKVYYSAGYRENEVPADLASACFELAAWKMNRYRGRRIGMTGSVRKDGEHFELSMPENVKALLEPYRRKTI